MKKRLAEIAYLPHFLSHPINGFWEIKKEKRGSLFTALLLLAVYLLSVILSTFFTSYLFNPYGDFLESVNLFRILLTPVGLWLLWCVSSWCLTSLFDGEGSFRDICVATSYALIPLIIVTLLQTAFSHMLTLNEEAVYQLIQGFGYLWFGLLLVLGTLVTHQYTFTKTLLIVLCTILGMCIILYIALLFINLLQQMISLATLLNYELSMRR